MSVRVMSRVWERSALGGSELLLLLAIADHADDEGRAYPSVETLAKKVRMSARNARYLLAKIERSGELTIARNAGPRGCNLFTVQALQPEADSRKGVKAIAARGAIAIAAEPSRTVIEPSITSSPTSPSATRTKRKLVFDANDLNLAKTFLARVKEVSPSIKDKNLEPWANEIRLMREQDQRTLEDIEALFCWANRDQFWRTNILSPAKLRKQWDQLQAKRGASRGHKVARSFAGAGYGKAEVPAWAK